MVLNAENYCTTYSKGAAIQHSFFPSPACIGMSFCPHTPAPLPPSLLGTAGGAELCSHLPVRFWIRNRFIIREIFDCQRF